MSGGRHGVGIPGVHIESQDHVCALYEGGARRDEVLLGFLRAGLEDGDKCVFVLDEDDPSGFLARLAEPNDLQRWQATGAINVRGAEPTRDEGDDLTIEEMLATWDEAMAAADESSPFPFVRVTGDATWWSTQAGADNLVRYESALTERLPENVAVMCCYDVAAMDGSTLVDAVRTHPTLLVGSVIIQNPFYLPADELEATRHGSAPADGQIETAIRQLARLPRLAVDRPMVELECDDCGTALFAPERGPTDVASAPLFITCPRCSAIWEQRTEGTLVRWWEGIDDDPR